MSTPTFGAYYHVYKNPLSTYKCLESFRKFYPLNTIILVSDNGYDYTEMAKYFNCTYIHCNEKLWLIYDEEDLKIGINGKQLVWVNKLLERLSNGFKLVKEDYFIWLEDDIVINKPVNDPLYCDINGYNPNSYCWPFVLQKLNNNYPIIDVNKKYTWSGGGGSIFNKKNILKYMENKDIIIDIVNNWLAYDLPTNIVCDFLLSTITHLNNGTVGPCNEIADGDRNNICSWLAVQHQYKRYYGLELPDDLKYLVNML